MALIIPKITKELEAAILAALLNEYGKEAGADPTSHQRMAKAIAKGVADVLIKALQSEAEILPGIGTAGSPAAQTSVTPGKIF
jgi:hypothetical protein